MAVAQVVDTRQASNTTTTGIGVTVAVVLVIVFTGWLMHRFHAKIAPSTAMLQRVAFSESSRLEEGTKSRTLARIPVLVYSSKIHWGEQTCKINSSDKESSQFSKDGKSRRHRMTTGTKGNAENATRRNTADIQNTQREKSVFNSETKAIKEEAPTCSICVSIFRDGENIRILPCEHMYHCCCIDPWLLDYLPGTCPLCYVQIDDDADGVRSRIILPIFASASPNGGIRAPEHAYSSSGRRDTRAGRV